MSFSETLKRLRLEKGLTQGDLAKYSGLKQSSIAMYETGKRNPKIDVLERLADFFNVDIDYLIGKTDKTTKVIVAPPAPQKNIETPPAPKEDREHKHLQNLLSDPHLRRILESSGQLNESSLQEVQNFIDFQLGKKKQ
ncbi:helix-turn-helix domain-containing protein [Selenomonas montiformis]|uniref:helix-turn-helix domain-containing protein n=1 Tax=Selenomonas montiformis TaxID=2652285 RepID=UPI003F97ED4A